MRSSTPPQPSNNSIEKVLAELIILHRGQGLMLPSEDYWILRKWLNAATDQHHLVAILDELLPDYYQRSQYKRGMLPRLIGLEQKVLRQLKLMSHHDNQHAPLL